MRTNYSIRTLLLTVAILSVLMAITVPTIRFVLSFYTDRLSPSMNVVWLIGGKIETDGDMKSVLLASTKIQNHDLIHVHRIDPYFLIDLSNTVIDDDGIPALFGVRANRIDLTNTKVTNTGVEHLKQNVGADCVVVWTATNSD